MRSSRRSKLAAAAVFVLMAFVVIGGMGWATVATLELAKVNVREQHRGRVLRAVTLMDSYIGGILNSESAREHTDYVAFSKPKEIYHAREGTRLAPGNYRLPSPLISPPHDWIDLYFHVEGGRWSSPHLPDEVAPWAVECIVSTELAQRQARDSLDWLRHALPVPRLYQRVTEALRNERTLNGSTDVAHQPVLPVADRLGAAKAEAQAAPGAEYLKRVSSHRASQRSYLAPGECITPGHNHDEDAGRIRGHSSYCECWVNGLSSQGICESCSCRGADPDTMDSTLVAGSVESKPEQFIPPFWLAAPDGESMKLVFLREGTARDGAMFHQGFVADWNSLAPKLLDQIDHLFSEVELLPIRVTSETPEPGDETKMASLPVHLSVPEVAGGAAAAAWQRVRPTLLTMWAAAAAVLIVAGLGLRNLVALTERRTQFAYTVTHELRTPLTTFRLYTDMLSAGLVPEKSKQEYLDTLNRESIRLSNLVEGVLEYARLENHRVRLNPVDTDGPSLLSLISDTLEKLCADNGIRALTENAVANGQPMRIDVDVVHRIAAVLVNNACRHARAGTDATVLVRLENENGQLHLDVIDSGPGIHRRDQRRIFKPFRRGRGADAAAQGGIGLGLALARGWAKLLGGKLELFSRHHPQYGGAHFRLIIPSQTSS